MSASLHVIEGSDRGRLFQLAGVTVTIGRSADNTIVLNDVAVSGTHSRLVRTESGQYTLHDNTSTNGTFVNGREARVVDLKHGDTIRVGGTVMAFEIRRTGGGILPSGGVDRGAVTITKEVVAWTEPTLIDPRTLDRDELERLVRRGAVLEDLDQNLASLDTPTEVLSAVLDAALLVTGARRGFVLLVEERTGEVLPSVVRDLDSGLGDIPFSKALAFEVVASNRGIAAEDSAGGGPPRPVLAAPIVRAGRAVGVLHLDRPPGQTFHKDDLAAAEAVGRRAGAAVDAARSRVDFEVLFSSMIDAMMKSIQAKDVYTRGHSERVRHYSRLIGKELGLSHQELYRLTLGAAVHDIGKIGMPDSVLKFNTNPKLSAEQMDEVKKHPSRGAQILGEIPFLRDVVAAAELHHEDWDGGGYPHGLKGEETPLIARIVAVADTYDAITTDRPYQKGQSYEAGHEILRKISGKRLDGDLVEAFVRGWHKYRKAPGPAPAAPPAAPLPINVTTPPAAADGAPEETFKLEGKEAAALRAGTAGKPDDTPRPTDKLTQEQIDAVRKAAAAESDDPDDLEERLRQIILIG